MNSAEEQKNLPSKLVNPCKSLNDEALNCLTSKTRKEVIRDSCSN